MEFALPKGSPTERERALDVLLSIALEPIVDLVAWSPAPDVYEVASAHGQLRFSRRQSDPHGGGQRSYHYVEESLTGEDPITLQDPSHLGSLAEEIVAPHPERRSNSYPHA